MNAHEWHIGQKVAICSGSRGSGQEPGVITKVGRKWLTVERDDAGRYPNPRQFSMDRGIENHGYGAPDYILTPEMALERERRSAAMAAMKELGWEPVGWSSRVDLTTEQIEAMVAAALSAGGDA